MSLERPCSASPVVFLALVAALHAVTLACSAYSLACSRQWLVVASTLAAWSLAALLAAFAADLAVFAVLSAAEDAAFAARLRLGVSVLLASDMSVPFWHRDAPCTGYSKAALH